MKSADTLNAEISKLYKEGRLREVEPLLDELVDLLKKTNEKMSYVSALNQLGGYYREMHKFEKAELSFKEAKELSAEILGIDHPDYATTINNFAGLYRIMKKFLLAEDMFLEAIKIYEGTIGKDHLLYASGLNNLGLLYQDMGKFEEAIELHDKALKILEKIGKEKNILTFATSLNNLASAYSYSPLENTEIISSLSKKALKIYEEVLGKNNSAYASVLNNLGSHYLLTGEYEEAKTIFTEALSIIESIYGRDHHHFLMVTSNLGTICERTGKLEEALEYYSQLAERYLKIYDKNHSAYKENMYKVALLKQKIKNESE